MIIKNNLATNPYQNYTLFFLACVTLTLFAVSFTVFNVTTLLSSFEKTSALQTKMAQQQTQLSSLDQKSAGLRRDIDRVKTKPFVERTEFINESIKKRVFSWTTLFNQFEKVLPDNVRMISVSPAINEEKIQVNMEVAGKSLDDILNLVGILENSAVFTEVNFRSERSAEDGLLYAGISVRYLPDQVAAAELLVPAPEGAEKAEEE